MLTGLTPSLAFALPDPAMPGVFSFEFEDSPIEEAVHAIRPRQDKTASAVQPALPARSVEPRDDSSTLRRRAVRPQPLTKVASLHPGPRSALLAPAPSPDDH